MKALFVVGIGPGGAQTLTPQAAAALEAAELLVGYTAYIELLGPQYPGKETLSTPMRREMERCRLALEAAQQGRTTAMVCSGDAGVYGMAGPILQLAEDFPEVEVWVVPGLTAANSGAAVLGAPLMNDYCVLSLSDLLTPWSVIEKRLRAAAAGDLCLCLYNPRSKKRPDHLKKACAILGQTLPGDTVCGWVRQIGRADQQSWVGTLDQLADQPADMFTTVFVGNSCTRNIGGRMVTARGYREE